MEIQQLKYFVEVVRQQSFTKAAAQLFVTQPMLTRAIKSLEEELDVRLIDIDATHDTVTVTELMDCAAFACGTPTLNIGMMPAMARTLTYVKGLRPQGKKGFVFGSYGWAEKGASAADAMVAEWGAERIREPLTVRFRPDAAVLEECFNAGKALGEIAAAVAE